MDPQHLAIVLKGVVLAALVTAAGCSGAKIAFTPADSFSEKDIPKGFMDADAVVLLHEDRVEISGEEATHELRIVKRILQSGHPEESAYRFSTDPHRRVVSL